MEALKQFESIGYIIKVESLTTVGFNILKNTLVLESLEPFPGYHGINLPSSPKPRIIYLVTKEKHGFEEIALISKDIAEKFKHRFTANPAEITIHSRIYHAIRVKFLESFRLIPELQLCFRESGIRFVRTKNIDAPSMIRVHRYYLVEEVEEGIYKDLLEPEQCYVDIHRRLNWTRFGQLTLAVKNNLRNRNFDAAQGVMFRYSGPVELVRIWDRDKTLERTREIRDKYLEIMRNMQLLP